MIFSVQFPPLLKSLFTVVFLLPYSESRSEEVGPIDSLVLHPSEVEKIPYLLRPAPEADTRQGAEWAKELVRIRKPSFFDRVIRASLNFYNMLRDAFGQASQAILGAISKDSSMGKIKNADKRVNEIGTGLTGLVPNAWEPILEKYRGHRVVVERKTKAGLVKEDAWSKHLTPVGVMSHARSRDTEECEE